MNRKNDDDKYVWYLEQEKVNLIERIRKSPSELSTACFSNIVYKVLGKYTFEILYDSDGLIRGVKNISNDETLI